MSWPEPTAFVAGVLVLTTLGAVLPLEAGRRQEHIVVTVTTTAQLAILGPRGLPLVWAAVAAGLVLTGLGRLVPGRAGEGARRLDRAPGRHGLWLVITATAVTVGFSLAYLVHVTLLGRDFPLDVSTSGRAAQAYLVLVVAWLGTMSVRLAAHRVVTRGGVAGRLGPGVGPAPGDPFDPFDSALLPYLLPTVAGAPVVVAAVALYDPGDPWLSLAVLLWCLPLYAACRFELHQRRLGQRLRREAEARRRLAAIGEVTARVLHQSRHHAGLMGWSIHRLRRLVGDPAPAAVAAAREELDQLAAAKRRLQAALEVELLAGPSGRPGRAGPGAPAAAAAAGPRDVDQESAPGVGPGPDPEPGADGEAGPDGGTGPDRAAGSLAVLVRGVVADLAGRARHRAVSVSCQVEGDAGAVAGPPTLRDALFNVVDNAIDAAAGRVTVSAAVDADGAHVTVVDDGPGLPAAVADRAFEPFVTTKPDGTGMGLPIAEAILDELGGTLHHHRRPGSTTFVLTVPLPPPSREPPGLRSGTSDR